MKRWAIAGMALGAVIIGFLVVDAISLRSKVAALSKSCRESSLERDQAKALLSAAPELAGISTAIKQWNGSNLMTMLFFTVDRKDMCVIVQSNEVRIGPIEMLTTDGKTPPSLRSSRPFRL